MRWVLLDAVLSDGLLLDGLQWDGVGWVGLSALEPTAQFNTIYKFTATILFCHTFSFDFKSIDLRLT